MQPSMGKNPAVHALRGFSASLATGTLVAALLSNRRALLSLRASQIAALRLAKPSRNTLAIAIFVGVFRFVERFEWRRKVRRVSSSTSINSEDESDENHEHDGAVQKALAVAATASILAVEPASRTPVIALLSINASSLWFRAFVDKHPELAHWEPLELLAFLVAGGWVVVSALTMPKSWEPAHLKLVMKYTYTTPEAATYLWDKYQQGLNPNTCDARHPGRECAEFFFNTFLWKIVSTAIQVYTPVHLTSYVLALRRRSVREKPVADQLRELGTRITKSSLYFITYILLGWTIPCYTNSIGSKSLAWRKVQLFLAGSLPALAIFFESPSRRRLIGVILCTYSYISMGSVLSAKKGLQWLQQGSGPARSLVDVVAFAAAVTYTMESITKDNAVFLRMLYGMSPGSKVGGGSRQSERADGDIATGA